VQGEGVSIESLLFCSDIAQELSNSAQIAESHGRLSEQRIEVTAFPLHYRVPVLLSDHSWKLQIKYGQTDGRHFSQRQPFHFHGRDFHASGAFQLRGVV
jgi:hypothetical protein